MTAFFEHLDSRESVVLEVERGEATQVCRITRAQYLPRLESFRDPMDEEESESEPGCGQVEERVQEALPLSSYVRVARTSDVATLRTSVRALHNRRTKNTVLLMAAHHCATRSYYHGIASHFEQSSAVIAEGYNPDGFSREDACEALRLVDDAQKLVAEYLGVVRRGDWEAGTRKRLTESGSCLWIPLDVSARWADKFVRTLPDSATQQLRRQVQDLRRLNPAEATSVEEKRSRLNELARLVARDTFSFNPPLLDSQRAKYICAGLDRALPGADGGTTYLLLYGAELMPALERHLSAKHGYVHVWTTWHDVLTVAGEPGADDEGEHGLDEPK
jgi:hypothetical protein